MALVQPSLFRRPVHPRGDVSLLASQRRSPAPVGATRLWLPSDLGSKLKTWLKGDDLSGSNGSSITTWTDASGNSNNATGGTNKPTLVTAGLNGLNTAAFAAASSQNFSLPTGLLTGRTQSAGFAVYKLTTSPPAGTATAGPVFGDFGTDSSANHNPWQDGNFYEDYCTDTRRTVTGVPASTSFRILGLRSKANDWRLDVNGTNYFTDATNTVAVTSAPLIGTSTGATTYLDGQIAEIVDCNDFLLTGEKEQVEGYLAWKWGLQASLPIGHTYIAAAPTIATGAVSHDTSGALVGPGSTVAGTAVYNAVHPTSGVLTGPGSTVVGSAARTREHATTGVLTGPGSTIVGVAVYNAKHATSGALTGQGSTIVGSAARTREHATTGVLTGPGSTVAGTAVYNAKHTTTGALTGPGSTVAGSAARFRAFATSGALVGPGSTIVGSAARSGIVVTVHATSGALIGQPSIIDGIAARTRQHATSGILTGPPSLIVGVVSRWRDHDTSGALPGVTSVVFGAVFNGTPQLHDIPVDSDNLTDETASPAAALGSITEPSGQIVNHPPYPAA